MKKEIKTSTLCNWLFRNILLFVTILPAIAFADVQLQFEWDPNVEPDIAGYRVFSRLAGEAYDYDHPDWEGQDAYCTLWIDNEDAEYFFVVRAHDRDGFESEDSNEVAYTPAGSSPPEDPPSEDPPSEDPPSEDPSLEDPPSEDPPSGDPPSEDPPDDQEEDELENLLVLDAATGQGQVYVYVDECVGAASVEDFSAIHGNRVLDLFRRPDDLFLGLIRIELSAEHIGGTANIPIYFSEPIHEDVRWYTYDDVNGWQDYSDHSFFSDNGMSVALELKDGSFGDADGMENGVIVCTSGPGRVISSTYRYSESGVPPSESDGGCFIDAAY